MSCQPSVPAARIRRRVVPSIVAVLAVAVSATGCGSLAPVTTPKPLPGSPQEPRPVNIVMHDYSFSPDPVDLVPGETVVLRVVNGGLDWHEAIIGGQVVQDAWEAAEAATVGAPPGPTPAVSVPPDVAGLRVVVPSGGRADVVWTVPDDVTDVATLLLGCHIPGHYARGMKATFRVVPTP